MISGCVFGCVFRSSEFGKKSEQNLGLEQGGFGGMDGRDIDDISPKEKLKRWEIEEMRSFDQQATYVDLLTLEASYFVMIKISICTCLCHLFGFALAFFDAKLDEKDVIT